MDYEQQRTDNTGFFFFFCLLSYEHVNSIISIASNMGYLEGVSI